jgi:hypothetical protein
MKKPFVAPTLKVENSLAVLTLGSECVSSQCPT